MVITRLSIKYSIFRSGAADSHMKMPEQCWRQWRWEDSDPRHKHCWSHPRPGPRTWLLRTLGWWCTVPSPSSWQHHHNSPTDHPKQIKFNTCPSESESEVYLVSIWSSVVGGVPHSSPVLLFQVLTNLMIRQQPSLTRHRPRLASRWWWWVESSVRDVWQCPASSIRW